MRFHSDPALPRCDRATLVHGRRSSAQVPPKTRYAPPRTVMPRHPSPSSRFIETLISTSAASSAILAGLLGWAYLRSHSDLALAQMADSVSDVFTSVALLWALRISAKPPDDSHPFGHHSAEPVAALVVAVLVGVLSAEVLQSAVRSLLHGRALQLGWSLVAMLMLKTGLKVVFAGLTRSARRTYEPAVHAFHIDARNDVLLGLTSVAGFFGAKYGGQPSVDAWLALPVGLWIGASGVMLGWQSVQLLMGTAPPLVRQRALLLIAESLPGVVEVRALKARHHGTSIHVWLEIHVDPILTIRRAHDIGEAVESRLLEESDVCDAVVHVDGAQSRPGEEETAG